MKKYSVGIPYMLWVDVEAYDEDEAEEIAHDATAGSPAASLLACFLCGLSCSLSPSDLRLAEPDAAFSSESSSDLSAPR